LILIRRLAYVAFFFEVGFLLVVLPWSDFWEQNYFAAAWPVIHFVVTNNFVRGAVSGLGVVNLGAGFADLVAALSSRERSEVSIGDRSGS
jgi:polyferredoxin